jgi:hypothetical protein
MPQMASRVRCWFWGTIEIGWTIIGSEPSIIAMMGPIHDLMTGFAHIVVRIEI